MGMQTDCVSGYGFSIYASDEQLKQFILKHREMVGKTAHGREILDYTDNVKPDAFNPKEDFYYIQAETGSDEGFYSLIADVMRLETGIRFTYHIGQAECDCDDSILFDQCYPWQMNAIEKGLTQEKLEEICKVYTNDLGGQLKPDFIRMEYFG